MNDEMVELVAKTVAPRFRLGAGDNGDANLDFARAIARAAIETIEAAGYVIVTNEQWDLR